MIDLNHGNTANRAFSERMSKLVDEALEATPQRPRKYLGASALGNDDDPWTACMRAVQLDYIRSNGLPGAPEPSSSFPGRVLRIFDTGHVLEDLAIKWMRAAGFELKTQSRSGGQIGFESCNGRFRGHTDGVLVGGPDIMRYPAIWEHKGIKNDKWKKLQDKGLALVFPGYHAQVSIYQAYLDCGDNPALFMATNKDTQEIYFELVPFDTKLAQETSDRAVAILKATDHGELLPKRFNDSAHHVCRNCKWTQFCWG